MRSVSCSTVRCNRTFKPRRSTKKDGIFYSIITCIISMFAESYAQIHNWAKTDNNNKKKQKNRNKNVYIPKFISLVCRTEHTINVHEPPRKRQNRLAQSVALHYIPKHIGNISIFRCLGVARADKYTRESRVEIKRRPNQMHKLQICILARLIW